MKPFKKALAFALAATLALGSCSSVLAATSPNSASNTQKHTNATATSSQSVAKVNTTKAGAATVKTVKNKKSVVIPSTVTVSGVKYSVTTIAASAFSKAKKATKITINAPTKKAGKITFKKNAFKGSSKKLKTLVIKINKKSQIKADKKAFSALKKSVVIKVNKNTTAKQLKKIQKALEDAGFKGKVKKA